MAAKDALEEFGRALMGLAWRVVDTGANCGAYNMGVDQVLAADAAQGPVLRFYGWDPPAVSCGWNQQPEHGANIEACRALGIDVVRRPTGGRAVLHWEELTYSVACVAEALVAGRRDRGHAPPNRRVLGRGAAAFRGFRPSWKGPTVAVGARGRDLVLAARRAGSSSAGSASWSAVRSGATDAVCCNTGRSCSAGRTSACRNL